MLCVKLHHIQEQSIVAIIIYFREFLCSIHSLAKRLSVAVAMQSARGEREGRDSELLSILKREVER